MVHEHHLTVARTARYYTIGEPGPDVRDLWIACHGYGQLAADFIARMQVLEAPGRLVVAPEGLSRFYHERARSGSHATSPVGASWMTREDRAAEIADQVAYLDALTELLVPRTHGPPVPLTVLGFSQGVATACRWLAHSRFRAHRLICWGGSIPEDVLKGDHRGGFRQTPLLLVAGSRDEFATADRVADAVAAVREAGLRATHISFEGGHRLDDATLTRIADRAI
jgi:predicted esterase